VPPKEAKGDSLVIVQRSGQTVEIVAAEKVARLLVWLDDRMMDLDKPVIVKHGAKELAKSTPHRTIANLVQTLGGRGDKDLMFDAEITVELPAGK
jgi:hypothetical protein